MKRILQSILLIMLIIGLVSIFGLLSSGLNPSEQAKSERSQHDITDLVKGSYYFIKFNRENAWNHKVLIIKDWDGKIFVHLLPTENNEVSLPDRFWGWAVTTCINFGPELESNEKISKSGIIKCHDKDDQGWGGFSRWKWNYSGKSLVEWTPDLYSPKYEIKDGTLYVNS